MPNNFKCVKENPPKNNQLVIAYKLKLINGKPLMTTANCVTAIFQDGVFSCRFIPTHWAEIPLLIEGVETVLKHCPDD